MKAFRVKIIYYSKFSITARLQAVVSRGTILYSVFNNSIIDNRRSTKYFILKTYLTTHVNQQYRNITWRNTTYSRRL
ncbi:hypothetical protein IQ05_00736 [Flavobacterium tiangeerense]|uniref:Uncharacterized protein n=1 Tax=Flavobacterium tiangeerense TaxID=459471 RepID=A0ABY3FLD2_9FLAO|nr:hypothetical protein IQ05_00736 [Flavobacterium tiangeerense]